MATKKLNHGFRITLSEPAKIQLGRLLSRGQTSKQKKTIKQASNAYARYQAKWQKTN